MSKKYILSDFDLGWMAAVEKIYLELLKTKEKDFADRIAKIAGKSPKLVSITDAKLKKLFIDLGIKPTPKK